MILIDFENIEPWSCSLGANRPEWTEEIYNSKFFGNQIFIVNGKDFSGDFPVLGFARRLNEILFNLKHKESHQIFKDPEFQAAFFIEFSMHDELVTLTARGSVDGAPLFSTDVLFDEIASNAAEYLIRVIGHCSQICPELKDQDVQRWLSDFTLPTWGHRLQGTQGTD